MNPLLYIHIPFCDTKCPYCSFNSFTGLSSQKERYFEALIEQLDFDSQRFDISKFKTIFFGGGTPSTVEPKYYEKLFKKLDISQTSEITIEANPNSANENWLKEIKDIGVNRLSLGVQSFQNAKLNYLGRVHTGKRVKDILEKAYKVGFQRISIDLIYGTKFDNKDFLEKEISELKNLPIDHLSLYSLTIEEGTPFQKIGEKNLENISETEWLFQKISKKFKQYEISNFGNPSTHNLGYWSGENYLGLGSGAVGFWKNFRYYPERNPEKYIENPTKRGFEKLSKQDLFLEKLFLGFRSKIGVRKSELDSKILKPLLEHRILFEKDGQIYNKNYLLADEITLKFT